MADTRIPTLPSEEEPTGEPVPQPRLETEREAAERVGVWTGERSWSWATIPVVALALLLLAAIPIAAAIPSSVVAHKINNRLGIEQGAGYARTPASANPVDDRINIGDLGDAAQQFPPEGDIYFVTVMHPEQSVLSWLIGKSEPSIQFLTREDVYGFNTPTQERAIQRASMATAEQKAQFVALQRIGFDVSIVPGVVQIQSILCAEASEDGRSCVEWSPSDRVLDPGDTIREVDGEVITNVDDLSVQLAEREPGDVVTMVIDRPEVGELEVEVELTSDPDDPDRTIVGFIPVDTTTVELPFELSIRTESIGGPSAGLAFTLTLLDELTEGELTGGGKVAVTGTIELDGSVGAIGGLRQKASAVAQAGVDLFLVPAAQPEDDIAAAREVAGDKVEIIPVATVDEALAVLESRGGDPLPGV